MNIYDPPMPYEPITAWQKYISDLKKDENQHAKEISRAVQEVKRIFGVDL